MPHPAELHRHADEPLELDCTIVETRLHEPGFYETATRVFYVTRRREVYLLRAPGSALMLQAVDDLEGDATAVEASGVDEPRRDLAALIERHATRTATAGGISR